MNTSALKKWGLVIAVGAVAVGGTWWYAAGAYSPRIAQVTATGCGPADFGLPIALLGEMSGVMPVTFGPITTDNLAQPLRISFDPAQSTTDRELTVRDGTLTLPTMFGRAAALPERIALTCRDGVVVSVRYTGGRSSATTFNVTVADAGEVLVESVLPPVDGEPAADN